ncbi:MAG: leucine-rich repeat domain-containing protein [Cyanobacteria bacterium J06621_8]
MSIKGRRGGYLATAEGVKRLKDAKRVNKYTYQGIAEAARETEDKVKRLFNPQWGNGSYKVGEEAVEAICNVLDLKPEEVVRDWYPLEVSSEQDEATLSNQGEKHAPSYYRALEKIEQAAKDQVKELDLAGMELSELPEAIGQLTNLSLLDFGENSLSSLPPEIGQLTNLTELYLYDNSLSSLPPEIGQLTNLTELYLYDNSLEIPPEIIRRY